MLLVDGNRLKCSGTKKHLAPERLQKLSDNKIAIISYLSHMKQSRPTSTITPRSPPGSRAPLAPSQRPLFLLDQARGGNPCDYVCHAFRIEGGLNPEALEHGFGKIVERHEVLRTTFHAGEGAAYQEIHAPSPVSISHFDLRDVEAGLREARARYICAAQSRRVFDLEQGPLLRVCLIRLAEQGWVLLVMMHHIITDGESFSLLCKELEELYAAFEEGRAPRLPDLPVQYADYAIRQNEALETGALASQADYWKARLSDGVAALDLPTDRPRPAVQSPIGARQSLSIPRTLRERLDKIGRAESATLFMTLLTAVDILLYRYSGQSSIAVGIPMSVRRRPEIKKLLGFFIYVMVHRTEVREDLTFREYLRQVSRLAVEGYGHSDLPFDELVRHVDPPRDPSRNPLFQVMFAFNIHAPVALSGLEVTRLDLEGGTAQFDLSIYLFEESQGVEGFIEYDTDLFDTERIERMAGHFDVLLRGIAADPDCVISRLPILTKTERQRVLIDWNQTAAPRDMGETLHGLFQSVVAKTPNAKALLAEDASFSLAELEGWANRLATTLSQRGAGPGEIVAICCKRSPRAIAGLIAILKCGAAYLPLDPTYPKERLKYMLQDSGASVLLVEEDLLSRLPGEVPEYVILDDSRVEPAGAPFPCPRLTDDAPAYVIYTSGSTGKPKGVVGTHRGIVNCLEWIWDTFPFHEDDICAQTTSLGFVDHIWEIFGPVLKGRPLRFFDDEELLDARVFLDRLGGSGVTRLTLVPSHLRAILDAKENDEQQLRHLRICFTGGEALAPDLAGRFFSAAPNTRLVNVYGSSEVAADVTAHEVTPDDVAAGKIPIGRPIDNVELYVLDREGCPVPIGIPGELYVGGCQLAQGYLNRPELTATKFPTVQIDGLPARRLFRTGDVVRYRPSGLLDFLGRIDQQIKLRGMRIELGEIESVLNDHPSVVQAVVIAREEERGGKRLVAHFVSKADKAPSLSELRTHVKATLPDYMVPSSFVNLEALPLTPSGKVDHRALPEPGGERPQLAAGFVASRTPVEEALAKIWATVLKMERVGIHDDFFELGGHSLLAMQICSRIHETFKVDVPLQSLFETRTVAGLSAALELESVEI